MRTLNASGTLINVTEPVAQLVGENEDALAVLRDRYMEFVGVDLAFVDFEEQQEEEICSETFPLADSPVEPTRVAEAVIRVAAEGPYVDLVSGGEAIQAEIQESSGAEEKLFCMKLGPHLCQVSPVVRSMALGSAEFRAELAQEVRDVVETMEPSDAQMITVDDVPLLVSKSESQIFVRDVD